MKAYPALFLVLSSFNVRAADGSGVRGAGAEREEDARRRRGNRRVKADGAAGGDRGSGLFGGPPGKRGGVDPFADPSDEGERAGGAPEPIFRESDLLEDARAVAKLLDLRLDDAQELLEQQRDFAGLVDGLQADADFLQAEMPSEPNGRFVLRYKNGDVPPDSRREVESFTARNKDTKLEIVPARFSLAEAEDRAQRLVDRLERQRYSHAAFSIDGDGIEVIAKKPRGRTRDLGGGRTLAARAAEILGLKADDHDLEGLALFLVEHDAPDPARPHHTYGGRKISGRGGEECTTAFSVIDASGTSGISTAAHCTDMNTYDALPGESDYPTVPQDEHKGAYGDVGWHTTSHVEPPYFYARPGARLPVRSVALSISKGQTVCAYSRMQGVRKCDRVFSTSVSVKYSGQPRMHKLVAMKSDFMVEGDSGGPWSFSDLAFGIHSGHSTFCDFVDDGCKSRDLWSRVMYLPSALGVMVIRQP